MLKVTKFGGSSLADAEGFARVRRIVLSDETRRVVVASAAGKRFPGDHKITDLLYLCHAHLQYGVSCRTLWDDIRARYSAIRQALQLKTPVEELLEQDYAQLSARTGRDALASRGEYYAARLLADALGFSFVDAADWLQFDYGGHVLTEESYAALRGLADGRRIVTPGFYGVLPSGELHTFSRGGSDITGSLAAAALQADVYENWTDVAGILTADPRTVASPRPISCMSYAELQFLSQVGTQVLHESAAAPVRDAGIPLRILSTLEPEQPGTIIGRCAEPGPHGVVGFAGRRQLSLLQISMGGGEPDAEVCCRTEAALLDAGLSIFARSCALGQLRLLLPGQDPEQLHAAADRLRQELPGAQVQLREELSVLGVLCREAQTLPPILAAVQEAGAAVYHLLQSPQGFLLTVDDCCYADALRAAYAAAFRS